MQSRLSRFQSLKYSRSLLLATLALASTGALAHPGHGEVSGWVAGLSHPFGLDHLLAMLAVGLWSAAALPGIRGLLGPATFVGSMCAGALLAMAGWRVPGVEAGIALSLVALGALLAAALSARATLGLIAIAAAGLLHGAAHGAEAPLSAGFASYLIGFVLTTAVLHGSGWLAGAQLRARSRALWRMMGAAISGVGLALLAG
jgi:urease accessory protein